MISLEDWLVLLAFLKIAAMTSTFGVFGLFFWGILGKLAGNGRDADEKEDHRQD